MIQNKDAEKILSFIRNVFDVVDDAIKKKDTKHLETLMKIFEQSKLPGVWTIWHENLLNRYGSALYEEEKNEWYRNRGCISTRKFRREFTTMMQTCRKSYGNTQRCICAHSAFLRADLRHPAALRLPPEVYQRAAAEGKSLNAFNGCRPSGCRRIGCPAAQAVIFFQHVSRRPRYHVLPPPTSLKASKWPQFVKAWKPFGIGRTIPLLFRLLAAPQRPQAASGVGQWLKVDSKTTSGLQYLPSGGTWAFFCASQS